MDPVTEARVRTGIRLPLMILTEAGRIDRATSIAGNPRESRHKAAFSSSACNESEPRGTVKTLRFLLLLLNSVMEFVNLWASLNSENCF